MTRDTWKHLPLDLLPPLLQEFVRLVGVHATMILVERFGGLRIYIPLNPTEDHPISQLIGLDSLRKLSKVYGREDHFQLPKAHRALLAIRDAEIRQSGKSIRQLAAEHDLTERQVSRIRGNDARNDDQAELFGYIPRP